MNKQINKYTQIIEYVHTHTYIRKIGALYIYIFKHKCMYIHINKYTHLHACIVKHTHTHMHLYLYAYTYMLEHMCKCMYHPFCIFLAYVLTSCFPFLERQYGFPFFDQILACWNRMVRKNLSAIATVDTLGSELKWKP